MFPPSLSFFEAKDGRKRYIRREVRFVLDEQVIDVVITFGDVEALLCACLVMPLMAGLSRRARVVLVANNFWPLLQAETSVLKSKKRESAQAG